MTRKITGILLLSIALTCTLKAQNFERARLDSFLNVLASHNKSMGSLAISYNGTLVYQNAIGFLDEKGKIPATANTKYRIGSVSKMFTAVMIFQLIEEGKLSLGTPLATYFPQLPNANKINIGLLLSHRSGLHNFTNDSLYLSYLSKPKTKAEMLAIFERQKPEFEPDAKAEYSNTNFVLLGYIIEKVTGKPYADELKRRITAKIGLADTYYGGKIATQNNEALSYSYNGAWNQEAETDMSIPGGAGGLVSTPTDLTKFIEALFSGKLISEASLERMKTAKTGFGMGMFAVPFYEKKGYGHNGDIDGFSSILVYFPEDRVAVAYISNGAVYPINDLLLGVLSTYFDKPFVIPSFKIIPLKTEDLDKYLGSYSSAQIPLKITVTKNNATLIAQGSGQPALVLDAIGVNLFEFTPQNIKLQFDPASGELIVLQGNGQKFLFTRIK